MDKIETINRQKSGKPKIENSDITWVEFCSFVKFKSEADMNEAAISLLRGDFLFYHGYTYRLIAINLRDENTPF